jgi:hypothetical protein
VAVRAWEIDVARMMVLSWFAKVSIPVVALASPLPRMTLSLWSEGGVREATCLVMNAWVRVLCREM